MIVLGLGSNLGDRAAYLQHAVTMLKNILTDMKLSKVYESKALLPKDAPREWDVSFFNMAVSGMSTLAPSVLLQEIKTIEHTLGRIDRGHWGPREIDIDILAYGDTVIEDAALSVPHKELLKRDFALIPMADIAPIWGYPVAGEFYGKTVREIVSGMPSSLKITDIVIQ